MGLIEELIRASGGHKTAGHRVTAPSGVSTASAQLTDRLSECVLLLMLHLVVSHDEHVD